MTEDALTQATSGQKGSLRRARRRRRQRRRQSVVALALGVAALGAASSPTGFGRTSGTEALGEDTRIVNRLDAGASDSTTTATAAAPAAEVVPVTAPAQPQPVPATAPAPAPPAVDQPIVAPPAFPARSANARTASGARSNSNARLAAAPAGPKAGGVWAVIIGIDDYPGEGSDLKAGTADARDVDTTLAHYGVPADRRVLLLDRQATAVNIKRALAWLAANASPDATVVFFYSGHIRQVSGFNDGDREEVDEALVAVDGVNVFDGEAAEILTRLEAKTAWIGVAGCYGSGFDDVLAPGRLITAAAAETDLAYENSALGHSYLVEYMVRRAMLQGAAAGSVQDAFNWARNEIARDYPNRLPVMVDEAKTPLVLGVKAAPTAPPPAAESSPPKPEPQQSPPQADPQPAPTTPPPGAADGETCAEVLGVGLCQEGRANGQAVRRLRASDF